MKDIHDGFSAYKTLSKKNNNKQQYCWAHILNNAKELKRFYRKEGLYIYNTLKRIYDKAKSLDHNGTNEDIEELYNELGEINGHYNSIKCKKFGENLLKKDKYELFEFVRNPEVEATNNAAERAIRPMVVYRKMSGGSRSEKGADNFAKMCSIFERMKKRGIDIFKPPPTFSPVFFTKAMEK